MPTSPDTADSTTGLVLVDRLSELPHVTIRDYCAASAEYIREATVLDAGKRKTAQLRLSVGLARAAVAALRAENLGLAGVVAGERTVGGGLRSVKADVSETTELDGLRLAIEIKPVHLAVGRAIWKPVRRHPHLRRQRPPQVPFRCAWRHPHPADCRTDQIQETINAGKPRPIWSSGL